MVLDLDDDGVMEAVLVGLDHDTVSVVGVSAERGALKATLLYTWYRDVDPRYALVSIESSYLDGAFTNRNAPDRGQPFQWVRYGGDAGTIREWTRRGGAWLMRTYEIDY